MRALSLLLGIALLGALGASPAAAGAIDWPPSGAVQVRAERARPIGHVAWEFRLRWETVPDGRLRFEIDTPRVHALDGRSAVNTAMRPMALAVEALDRMTPAWFVSAQGEWLGSEAPDSNRAPEAVLAASTGPVALDPEIREELLALLSSSAYRTLAAERPRQLWRLWFDRWRDLGDDAFESAGEANFRGREGLPVRELWLAERRLVGTPRERIEITCTYESTGETPDWLEEVLGPHTGFERRGERQASIRARDGLPLSVAESASATWTDPRGETHEEFEQSLYAFAWP